MGPIPKYRFDTSKTVIARVDDFSTVRYEKNNYSVPARHIGKEITVKGYANRVHMLYQGTMIAKYPRCYAPGNTKYQLEHYLDLLDRKPRAVFQARPVKDNLSKELLEWGKLLPGGNKDMVKLLRLCVDYGQHKILAIKRQIPNGIVPTVDMIRSYLNEPVFNQVIYLKQDIPILDTDLTKYDRKYGVVQ